MRALRSGISSISCSRFRSSGAGAPVVVDPTYRRAGVSIGDLDQLEEDAEGVPEVDPAPAGQHPFVDDVDRAEELDPGRFELLLGRRRVLDVDREMGRPTLVGANRRR